MPKTQLLDGAVLPTLLGQNLTVRTAFKSLLVHCCQLCPRTVLHLHYQPNVAQFFGFSHRTVAPCEAALKVCVFDDCACRWPPTSRRRTRTGRSQSGASCPARLPPTSRSRISWLAMPSSRSWTASCFRLRCAFFCVCTSLVLLKTGVCTTCQDVSRARSGGLPSELRGAHIRLMAIRKPAGVHRWRIHHHRRRRRRSRRLPWRSQARGLHRCRWSQSPEPATTPPTLRQPRPRIPHQMRRICRRDP